MTQHASFRSNSSTGAKRNVLKRFERVEILKKRGDFKGAARDRWIGELRRALRPSYTNRRW